MKKNISNVQSYFNKKAQEFQRKTYDYKYVSHVLFLMPMFLVHKNPLNGEEENITSAHRKQKNKRIKWTHNQNPEFMLYFISWEFCGQKDF